MDTIKVVDARMGRGKSTAAIRFINQHKKTRKFMYVTPFLTEVARFRRECGLEEPTEDDEHSKLACLRQLLYQGKSISTTHSLYQLIDDDMLDIIRDGKYTLIVDETLTAIEKPAITFPDKCILDTITTVDDTGLVTWNDAGYEGKFSGYKDMADRRTLYDIDHTMIHTFNTNLFTAFEDVYLLTYLFKGSMLEAYMNCFDLPYEIWGIGTEDTISAPGAPCTRGGSVLVPGADVPPPLDFRPLLSIVDKKAMNAVGEQHYALAKNWYERRSYHNEEIIQLRKNMHNFFKNITKSNKDNRLWTCFKDHADKLIPDNGSYAKNFLQMQARATNDFARCSNLAYMANRFEDPNMMKFFHMRGCDIDQDLCALSDMLQWIWRSSIRNNRPIQLYLPSRRMRDILTDWLDRTADGAPVECTAECLEVNQTES